MLSRAVGCGLWDKQLVHEWSRAPLRHLQPSLITVAIRCGFGASEADVIFTASDVMSPTTATSQFSHSHYMSDTIRTYAIIIWPFKFLVSNRSVLQKCIFYGKYLTTFRSKMLQVQHRIDTYAPVKSRVRT